MTSSPLTDEHLALLEARLFSFERLEILHAIRKNGSPMTRAEIEASSRLDIDTVVSVLAELEQAQLVEHDPVTKRHRVGPQSREAVCESLMALYQEDRIAVLSALSAISVRRIRGMAAHAFADAFVLRKKPRGTDG